MTKWKALLSGMGSAFNPAGVRRRRWVEKGGKEPPRTGPQGQARPPQNPPPGSGQGRDRFCLTCGAPHRAVMKFNNGDPKWILFPTCECEEKAFEAEFDRRFPRRGPES
jgi:hypothetical protein